MKVVLHYRHEDGRLLAISGDAKRAEMWLVYPHRELLDTVAGMEAGKAALPEGFTLEAYAFSPPCPKCSEPSPMSVQSGMYVCPKCDANF